MQAIEVRYLGPTEYRGSRYSARAGAGSVTIACDSRCSDEANATYAAMRLSARMGWDSPGMEWVSGTLNGGRYVFVAKDKE